MGRVITVAMKCDRCGVDYQGDEIDLLGKDSDALVAGAKETLSEVPAFELKMNSVHLKYDDLCVHCRDRLTTLVSECGQVTRRGHKRGANAKQTKLNTEGTSIKELATEPAVEGKDAKPKPPAKPAATRSTAK